MLEPPEGAGMECESSRDMAADSRTVFEIAADVSTMHRWLPGEIHVHEVAPGIAEAEVATGRPPDTGDRPAAGHAGTGGTDRASRGADEPDALMRTSPDRLRLEWGTRGRPDYTGWLQVTDQADGTSEVVVHLSFLGDAAEGTHETPPEDAARRELERSLDRLADEVERRTR